MIKRDRACAQRLAMTAAAARSAEPGGAHPKLSAIPRRALGLEGQAMTGCEMTSALLFTTPPQTVTVEATLLQRSASFAPPLAISRQCRPGSSALAFLSSGSEDSVRILRALHNPHQSGS